MQPGPKHRRPWDQWFSRPKTTLRQGTDYTCGHAAMAQQIRNAASQKGYRISIGEGTGCLVLTVHNPGKPHRNAG
jgi:hypothetical protein